MYICLWMFDISSYIEVWTISKVLKLNNIFLSNKIIDICCVYVRESHPQRTSWCRWPHDCQHKTVGWSSCWGVVTWLQLYSKVSDLFISFIEVFLSKYHFKITTKHYFGQRVTQTCCVATSFRIMLRNKPTKSTFK